MYKKKLLKIKFILIIPVFCFGSLWLIGQKITGKVFLSDGSPADFSTVSLLQAEDSTLTKGEVTDFDGNFEILLNASGKYLLKVSYVGYQDFTSDVIEFSQEDLVIPDITLQTTNMELNTVTVVARRPLIVVKADRTVFNTAGNIASAGSNGLELLRKAPGVMIDNDENIMLRGRNGVLIYLDGKRSYLNPQELADLLKSLDATDVESIEIITNPSAKYDASGNAGIINIITKKGKALGTNGTVNLTTAYGKAPKNMASVNLNHRGENINIYGGGSIGRNRNLGTLEAFKTQDNRLFHQFIDREDNNAPINGKLGLDYSKNPKHSFGVLLTANSNLGDVTHSSFSVTDISNGSGTPIDSFLLASSAINSHFLNAGANANYRYADESGNELGIDINRGWYRANSSNVQPNRYTDVSQGITLAERNFLTETESDIDIYTAKADYEKRFDASGLSLSAGAKFARVISDNIFDFYNENGQDYELDVLQSNQFIYTEDVAAAYVNALYPISKQVTIQAGLRWENTHSVGDLKRHPSQESQADDKVERQYDNFFPSAALTYNVNDAHGFAFSYSRRVDRPVYSTLNPFEVRIDDISFRKGNPFLNPQFSNNYELKYILKGSTTFGLSYSKSIDNIVNIIELDRANPDRIFVNFRNMATRDYYALNVGTPTTINSWWNGFINLTVYQSSFNADFPEFSFNIKSPISVNLFAQQTFTLGNDWTFEASGWYNSSTLTDNGFEVIPMGSLDLGIQKKILNGNGSLKLSYSDLFLTANWVGYNNAVDGLTVHTFTERETRILQLNFNYRFGKNTVKGSRNRETGLEDENNRIR